MSRPSKTPEAGRHDWTVEDRSNAAAQLVQFAGCAAKAARACGIPVTTIKRWKNDPEFQDLLAQAQAQLDADMVARMREVIDLNIENAKDRALNGDFRIGKDGELIRVPVGLKENVLAAAILTDKVRIYQGQPTAITQVKSQDAYLKDLAEKLRALGREAQGRDITPQPPGPGEHNRLGC